MIEFEPISLKHRPIFVRGHAGEPTGSSGDSFGCVYLWNLYCQRNIAQLGERVGIEFLCPQGIFYAFPFGSGELGPAVDALADRAATHGLELEMRGLTPRQKEALEAAFPGQFEFSDERRNYDYIYDIDAMASLAGNKLHRKRNFCNRFEKSFSWSFMPISPDRFDDCLALQDEWIRERGEDSREEDLAIRRMLREWDSLDMLGGVLYADGKPAGFTAAERITPDMVDIHFEKARADIPGAYPIVSREFARMVKAAIPEVKYLNREEDMGLPNLQKAKEEWYPLFLLAKSTARRRNRI